MLYVYPLFTCQACSTHPRDNGRSNRWSCSHVRPAADTHGVMAVQISGLVHMSDLQQTPTGSCPYKPLILFTCQTSSRHPRGHGRSDRWSCSHVRPAAHTHGVMAVQTAGLVHMSDLQQTPTGSWPFRSVVLFTCQTCSRHPRGLARTNR